MNTTNGWTVDDTARQRALATLERYVRLETPTGDGASITAFVDQLAERYRGLGGDVTLHPFDGGAHLVADFAGAGNLASAASTLLIGHSDTVWPRGTLDGDVPWTNDGERITGPGVYDMKSGLVVIEEALTLVRASGADHVPVRVVVTADEEIGSPTSSDLVVEAARGCSAALGFESPHPDGDLKVGRLGSTRVQVDVTGIPAHAAIEPEKGVSATEELLDQLLRVREIATAAAQSAGEATILYNLGSIEAPGRANVVAERASALLGFRFSDPQIEGGVLDALDRLRPVRERAGLELTRVSYRPAWKARTADELLAERISLVSVEVGGSEIGHAPAAGAADTNLLGTTDIAVIDGFGPRGGGAHARSEHIVIASLWERIALLAAYLAGPHPS
ncbi:MAG: M20/M25/M40 family metallo-hydrolase [Glaciihabitans sp.]